MAGTARAALSSLVIALVLSGCGSKPDPLPGFPRLVLWAWERPENLSYITPQAGVAYLAATLTLQNGKIETHFRSQPLWIRPETPLIAVVRIESDSHGLPGVSDVVRQITLAIRTRPIRALQIDFDARRSERSFYLDLTRQLRQDLHTKIPLEISVLVSWCEQDRWLEPMPIADAVPMFFPMGADPHVASESLREPLCQSSIGISTDEFDVSIPRGRRVFVFNPRPWTENAYRAVLHASRSW